MERIKKFLSSHLFVLLALFTISLARLGWSDPSPLPSNSPPSTPESAKQPPASGRSSSINFDDEIVEGMNKNPFDSLTNIYKRDNRDQKRLYRKKDNFNYELKLTIREMGL